MLNLKKFREKKGVSQAAVARELGISRQTYNNYELGKREADYETLLKLAEYFETTVQELISDICYEAFVPDNKNIDDDETLTILNRNAKKLTPENRKKLLDMARLMFKEEFDD